VIKSVLVAVDGSENSSRALDFALDLADKYGATLTILNVSESPPMGVVPFEPVTVSGDSMVLFSKDLKRLHEEILNKAVVRAKELNPKLLISTKLREGDPALEIIAEAKEGKFGILVIGHRGSSRVREIFMGKISEKVSHLTPCPVVIVK
jgi:nucleotide-binding universal stress UspA family protein